MKKQHRKRITLVAVILCIFSFYITAYANLTDTCQDGTHEYESEILIPNTEQQEGQVRNTCSRCGHSYIEYLSATGHQYGQWETVEDRGDEGTLERRVCNGCHRSEERLSAVVWQEEARSQELGISGIDYVLSTSIGGVWGYVAITLWYNSLVFNWYRRECAKKEMSDE